MKRKMKPSTLLMRHLLAAIATTRSTTVESNVIELYTRPSELIGTGTPGRRMELASHGTLRQSRMSKMLLPTELDTAMSP